MPGNHRRRGSNRSEDVSDVPQLEMSGSAHGNNDTERQPSVIKTKAEVNGDNLDYESDYLRSLHGSKVEQRLCLKSPAHEHTAKARHSVHWVSTG